MTQATFLPYALRMRMRWQGSHFHLILIFVFIFGSLGGCAHRSSETYVLRLKGTPGQTHRAAIDVEQKTQIFEEGDLARESLRNVHFKILSEVREVDPKGNIRVTNKTYEKKGDHPLNVMGYPDLRETVTLELNPYGRVLSAKTFEKESIFFLPPVLLPQKPVGVRDRWQESFTWQPLGQTAAVRTDVACELAGLVSWQDRDVFKIKIRADTTFAKPPKDIYFHAASEGYFLWDNELSSVVYSESESQDVFEWVSSDRSSRTQTTLVSRKLP